MGKWRRRELKPGIYDELISVRMVGELERLDPAFSAVRRSLGDKEDVAAPVATLLSEAIDLALTELRGKPDETRSLAEAVLAALRKHAPRAFERTDELSFRPERLHAIAPRLAKKLAPPIGSLHVSRLVVNAEGESLLDHLRSEFETADRVDLLCAFVKLSGFEKFRTALETHCEARGRPLRVLTTTYMGASDAKAIERFAALRNAEVKVSFDEASTRLHAKAWIFHRASGYSTAYVGSSNLSHAAQTEGLEWNVRVTESDQPAVMEQMIETFKQYWEDANQFEKFKRSDEAQWRRLSRALSGRDDRAPGLMIEIDAKDFQKPVLAELTAARRLGRHRNLLVAATGTGKTVMAALDYRALRSAGEVDSLLFVAHRREILEQSRRIFRAALQVQSFGEMLFDGQRPEIGKHVFASIDSLTAGGPVDPARFDMVILDEAHHTAARTWEELLEIVQPKELLGLTGTPERADGLDYEHHFPRPWIGNLRVWNAIPHALVPFRYYMLDVDGVDLRDVAWRAGRYASEALAGKLVTAADIFVQRAIRAIREHIARPDALRAIAFCASVNHAEAVDGRLRAAGLRSQVLTAATANAERQSARHDLDSGHLQVLCVVDLYNEGVDLPNVNTLFFFRPTESATVFLQQLGRGLRRAPMKSELVVFDLTGRQNLQFRFDRRLRAMLGHTPREVRELVEHGFGRLPAGCHLHFDELAQQEVLAQLKRTIPSDLPGIRALLKEPAHAHLSLAKFLAETDVALADLYPHHQCWTLLRRSVSLDARQLAAGELDALKNVHKLLHVGDELRLERWERLVARQLPASEHDHRVMRMLFVVLYGKETAADDAKAWSRWVDDVCLREEVSELVPVLRSRNALLAEPHRLEPEIPLALHARYLGAELSAAFDARTESGVFRDYYTGVESTPGRRFDLLLVTLEKATATKEHLRYRDFPLHETRFHWQSKARTRRDSREGRRHLHAEAEGCTSLLLVRERSDDRAGVTMAFRYLGPVDADGDSGERPITVEWRLRYAMPAELVQAGRIAS